MVRGQTAILVIERVRDRMTDAVLTEILPEFKNISAELLDFDVLRFGDVPNQQMDGYMLTVRSAVEQLSN